MTDYIGDLQSTSDAIHTALTMSEEDKKSNWEKLFAVRFFLIRGWGKKLILG